jgi:hypothetical protein
MNRKENVTFEMLTKMADCVAKQVSLFEETSAAPEILKALEDGITKMSEEGQLIVSAETAIRLGQIDRTVGREELKTALVAASQVAEALNFGEFQMPSKRNDRSLIDSGRALVKDAEPMRKAFAQHGVAFETVTAAADKLEAAIRAFNNGRLERRAAARRWAAAMEGGLKAVKRYDALVSMTVHDPAVLAAYATARAVTHTGGRKAAAEPPPSSTAAVA